jgi:DNA polymerase III epsilon subunit-like protein
MSTDLVPVNNTNTQLTVYNEPTIIRQLAVLALDIETTGPNMIHHGMIAIGYCLGDINNNVIESGRFCIQLDKDQDYDAKTWTRFWSKHQDILEIIKKEARPPKEQMMKFAKFIDALDDKYNLRIITDNPSFDVAFINYYLAKYTNKDSINYRYEKEYRPIIDTDSYSRGLLKKTYITEWVSDSDMMKQLNITVDAKTTHLPDEDATYIYKFHTKLISILSG